MHLFSILKPDSDKWALSIFLLCLYWIIFGISEWSVNYLHSYFFPALADPIPYTITLPAGMMDSFNTYWREVMLSRLHFLPVKIVISFCFCYLSACLLLHVMVNNNNEASEG